MEPGLYDRTLQLLRQDGRPLPEIARGSGCNLHWLGKFKQGRVRNPGVLTVEQLYTFLTDHPPPPGTVRRNGAARPTVR